MLIAADEVVAHLFLLGVLPLLVLYIAEEPLSRGKNAL